LWERGLYLCVEDRRNGGGVIFVFNQDNSDDDYNRYACPRQGKPRIAFPLYAAYCQHWLRGKWQKKRVITN